LPPARRLLLLLLLLRRCAAQRDIHQRKESWHAHLPFFLQRGGWLVDRHHRCQQSFRH